MLRILFWYFPFLLLLSYSLCLSMIEAAEFNISAVDSDTSHRRLAFHRGPHAHLTSVQIERMKLAKPKQEADPWMRRVTFFGDSMFKTTDKYFGLFNMLEMGLKNSLSQKYSIDTGSLKLDFKHYTEAGGRIVDIYYLANEYFGLWKLKGYRPPHIVLIYTVSDMFDVNHALKKGEFDLASSLINWYEGNLTSLLIGLKECGVMHTIVVGPALYGARAEIPTFWQEQKFIDDMNAINAKACAQYGATHIELRTVYQNFIRDKISKGVQPKDLKEFVGKQWPKIIEEESTYAGILTFDGEHPNYAGTKIMVNLFIQTITNFQDIWLSVGKMQVP